MVRDSKTKLVMKIVGNEQVMYLYNSYDKIRNCFNKQSK